MTNEFAALRSRAAAVLGIAEECALPARGVWHALMLAARVAARRGARTLAMAPSAEADRIAYLAGLARVDEGCGGDLAFTVAPDPRGPFAVPPAQDSAMIAVIDESWIAFSDLRSQTVAARTRDDLIILRNLATEYGVDGESCVVLVANPAIIGALADEMEPDALAPSALKRFLTALDPAQARRRDQRILQAAAEKARLAKGIGAAARAGDGPFIFVRPAAAERDAIARYGVAGAWVSPDTFRIDVVEPGVNDRALMAFGALSIPGARRAGEVLRETKETRITARVDLDQEGGSHIETGVGFFDHMLEQVAAHGGFTLQLVCAGDLGVDTHHTIEDCAIALGQALREALGEKRGIARYGFVLPMDEAEARISLDLGGRPYLVFDAKFVAPLLGAYPTEMTEHVFRSLSQSLGASIHLSVVGENDHHKTEACFKALGRALRQAARVEGDATPSTKGALA